jgi:hypothetical protein
MAPGAQEERQLAALVNKVELLGPGGIVVGNLADPQLLKQQEIQLNMDPVAGPCAVIAQDTYQRERRRQLFEKIARKIVINFFGGLLHRRGYGKVHSRETRASGS